MNSTSKPYFEKVAAQWDSMQQSFFSSAARQKAYTILQPKPGDAIADIGAGTGYMTEGIVDKEVKIIAVDQSQAMLQTMREKFEDNSCIEYRVGDSENLPIANGEVDAVLANMYLHHVERPAESIKEMARTLKPGGKLIITDLDEHKHEFLRTEQFDRWLGFKRSDVKQWFTDAGLKNIVVDCVESSCCSKSQHCNDSANISIFIAYGTK